MTIQCDLRDTAYDFPRVVWPAIRLECGGGEFRPVEGNANEPLRKDLDTLAGIDGMQILPGRIGMRGIASRIQWGDRDWGSFTLRDSRGNGEKTEIEKRMYVIDHPEQRLLFPPLTVQAYISERRTGHLLSAALAHTEELIPWAVDAYRRGAPGVVRRAAPPERDGTVNHFLAVFWDAYKLSGNHLVIVRPGHAPEIYGGDQGLGACEYTEVFYGC